MNIIQDHSPNQCSRNGQVPDMVVCHITDGAFEGAVATLKGIGTDKKVSANFVVSRTGEVVQLVPINCEAFCNGTQTTNTKGGEYYKNALSPIVRSRKLNANSFTVSIEHEGIWEQTKGALTPVQMATTIELIKFIKSEIKRLYNKDLILDRDHIIGHYQIDPLGKPCCPGALFPFDEIIKELNTPTSKQTVPVASTPIEVKQAPAAAKPTASAPAIKIDGKVKVNPIATKYATGQSMPAFVKGETFTVAQIEPNKVLLKEINSWVNTSDLTAL
jgi:N-acetyl-anhydromuramyl-L-alanine amidase AmpD